MRNYAVRYCLLTVVCVVGASTASADCDYSKALRLHWSHMRKMLTQITAAMPEEKFDYRPVKEVRSFRRMVLHLVQDGTAHMGTVASASANEISNIEAKYTNLKTRTELLKALDDFYDYGDRVLADITDANAMQTVTDLETKEKMTRVEAALMAFEDQIDHYGNFVVYLRMNKIVPPVTAEAQRRRMSMTQPGK
jgi:uncharacterized damage-inducible protein DinB